MAVEYVSQDDFQFFRDNIAGHIQVVVDTTVRASEKRLRAEIQQSRAELQAFRERHDVELAQVHEELMRVNEMLLYIVQRLPIQPLQSPPAQFLNHEQ